MRRVKVDTDRLRYANITINLCGLRKVFRLRRSIIDAEGFGDRHGLRSVKVDTDRLRYANITIDVYRLRNTNSTIHAYRFGDGDRLRRIKVDANRLSNPNITINLDTKLRAINLIWRFRRQK